MDSTRPAIAGRLATHPHRANGRAADRARLREAELRFRHMFDHAPIGMALVDTSGAFIEVNRSLAELSGYDESALLHKTFQEITHPDDLEADLELMNQLLAGERRTYKLEKRYRRADGSVVWVTLSVSLVRDPDGEPLYFIAQIEDISERKALEERLLHLATHDEMTGVFNRRHFDEELGRQIEYAERYGHSGALLMLDLDNFKVINDTLGHQAGDELVKGVADRLRTRLRTTDLLGRLGGDEFGVFLPQVDAAAAERLAEALVRHVAEEPIVVDGEPLWTRGSIGVALFDRGLGLGGRDLLMRADAAMYEAKSAGGHRSVVARTDPVVPARSVNGENT
jgi:diguanylate cyclase (GGDEF)-like protein/PAS domain S-box-containing protein